MSDFGTSPFGASPFGTSPFTDPGPPPPALPPATTPLRYELRPLSLGEILDRTFAVYRQKFWLYAGISTFSAMARVVSMGVQFSFMGPMTMFGAPTTPPVANEAMMRQIAMLYGFLLVAGLLALIVYGLTQAATAVAFSNDYLGEETSIKASFQVARKHWFRYILILVWQGLSAAWLPFVLFFFAVILIAIPGLQIVGGLMMFVTLFSLVYSAIAYIRNSLGVIASVIEDTPVRAAMKRSKFLVAGHKGRVFCILLLTFVLQIAVGMIPGILTIVVGVSHGPIRLMMAALTLLLTFCGSTVVLPVMSISLCLLYVDERVRKEGFDVEVLMMKSGTPPPIDALPSPFTSELA